MELVVSRTQNNKNRYIVMGVSLGILLALLVFVLMCVVGKHPERGSLFTNVSVRTDSECWGSEHSEGVVEKLG